jgi:TRAP-type C4-dicarboxylate transport system substrate-binding protein
MLTGTAAADAQIIRMATAAPDGTGWARELRAFAKDVENTTHGEVKVKLYFGGIAGNELDTVDRMQRGQLDAVASGGMLCQQLSPSFRIMRVRGLFDSHEEAVYVLNRLKPIFDLEFRARGFVHMGFSSLGPDLFFLRRPVKTFAELKQQRLWRWNIDEAMILQDREAGMAVVPLPVEDAGRAYDEGQVDGFVAVPAAALAFQWFSRARYLLDLKLGELWSCLMVTAKASDRMSNEQRQAFQSAAAKLAVRVDAVRQQTDNLLLSGLFQKQGLTTLPSSEGLRNEARAAEKKAMERLGTGWCRGPSCWRRSRKSPITGVSTPSCFAPVACKCPGERYPAPECFGGRPSC